MASVTLYNLNMYAGHFQSYGAHRLNLFFPGCKSDTGGAMTGGFESRDSYYVYIFKIPYTVIVK